MIFRTKIEIPIYNQKITVGNKLFFIGSCFADNIGTKLKNSGLDCTVNPYGTTYNPVSACKVLDKIASEAEADEKEIIERNSLWYSFLHHTLYNSKTKENLIERIASDNSLFKKKLEECDFLFITLGTAWVYEDTETGKIVNNCHKLPAARFHRYRLNVNDIVDGFSTLFASHTLFNKKNIVLTVSPVRHLKDGLEGNALSKSILRVATAELCSAFPNVSYFPAYEIMNDDLRDYRFYYRDMVHPSETAVDYIYEVFTESFADENLKNYMAGYGKLKKAADHRPFNAESPEYFEFRKKTLEKAVRLQENYPQADLSGIMELLK